MDILYENLELVSKKLDLVEENIDMSHKLINQIRQLSLSSMELIKNNNITIPPALEEKLREDIKKLKQSIDLLLTYPKKLKQNEKSR